MYIKLILTNNFIGLISVLILRYVLTYTVLCVDLYFLIKTSSVKIDIYIQYIHI